MHANVGFIRERLHILVAHCAVPCLDQFPYWDPRHVVSLHKSKEFKLYDKTTGLIRNEISQFDKLGNEHGRNLRPYLGRTRIYRGRLSCKREMSRGMWKNCLTSTTARTATKKLNFSLPEERFKQHCKLRRPTL